ncbi:MAG: diacylglycerol kinase family protein, partial [Bacteroidota bacterium]
MISQKSDTRKLLVVYNPAAGNHTERIREKVESTLSEKPLTFKFNPTSPNGNIDFKESAAISPFTEVIIIGGDGTINAVINSIDLRIPVAIIPSGTGNDFVKMLSIGRTIEEQIQTALTGELIDVDLGICNGHLFANGIGIGFDGQIVEDMAVKRVPFLRGHAAYYFHVLRILGGYKEKQFSYEADGKKYDEKLILLTIGNGSTIGGGFKFIPNSKLYDGYLLNCEIGPLSGF